MKIFGLHITTNKAYRNTIAELQATIADLQSTIVELQAKNREHEEVIEAAFDAFPLVLGQTVYDIALKDDNGRYTKVNPSLEHCVITPVEVTEKNYFGLVGRVRRDDVFFTKEDAAEYLKSICK